MSHNTSRCRSCGNSHLATILDLGQTPLANALLRESQLPEPETYYPLKLVYCQQCTLVQITETVSPEELFSHYLYFSSFSDTMLEHAGKLAKRLVDEGKLDENSLAVEVASNDGYLLQYYQQYGVPVLGIDPAKNIAKVAQEKGIPTLAAFFGTEVAAQLCDKGKYADVIHAHNVLAHVADLNDVVAGMSMILKDEGQIVIEAPYVKDLVDHIEFDTIYHEHLCYFSLTALDHLFTRHGLAITHVERIPIHGGSLRIFARRAAQAQRQQSVIDLLIEERGWGVHDFNFYRDFGSRVEALKAQLCALLANLKAKGKSIAAYGASAKGSTLLNYFGIGGETLDFVVDRSTVKQGYYTPGTYLPIVPPDALLEKQPDYALLLVWNFADEVLQQQQAYRDAGGKFIIPIPEVRVV